MCSNYLSPDFDEIFENETSDINSITLNDDHLLWNSDLLNLNSNEFNFDTINDSHLYDNFHEKVKCKAMDFDSSLSDFNNLLRDCTEPNQVKLEPTNSVSSTYLTDESSHPSSINSSPVSSKLRKRSHATLDSDSEKSFALYDEFLDLPAKAPKVELIKPSNPNKIYKLTKDIKCEPIYINSVTIRQCNASAPYVVHKLPSGIKTVNILPQKYTNERPIESLSINVRTPQISVQDRDQDFLPGDLYDTDTEPYSDYRSQSNGYYHQTGYSSISQAHVNKTIFQPIPQNGPMHLTEEEKRTLLAEGYSIPTRLPLTKQDERNLKKVRRKIKNKISAQESRRKKKEYLDSLEKKMDSYEHERVENKRHIEQLENTQRSLYSQIRHLQQQLMNKINGPGSSSSTGLMLFMVCFALLLAGGTMPSAYRRTNMSVSSPSIYLMGYGMSSSSQAPYTNQSAWFKTASQGWDLKKWNSPQFSDGPILRRQSILLGDDYDDVISDDLAISYVESMQHSSIFDHVLSINYSTFKVDELTNSGVFIDYLSNNIDTVMK